MKNHESIKGSAALVMVIIMMALVTTIGVEIAYRSQVSAKLVSNRKDEVKAMELAKAAFRWSMLRISLDGTMDKIPAIEGTNIGGLKDDLSEFQWAMPLPFPLPIGLTQMEKENTQLATMDLGGTFMSTIFDESSRINLNDVGSGGIESNRTWSGASYVLEDLLLSPRFKGFVQGQDHRALLFAIEDWIDQDGTVNHTAGSLEDIEYKIDHPDYHIKNGPFYTTDEVRMLKPMNDDFFEELKPFITVYPFNARLPRLSTQPVSPISKINVNTAPVELIAAIFNRQALSNPKARLECAQMVAKARQLRAFRSIKINDKAPSFLSFLQTQCGANLEGGENQKIISVYVEPILAVKSNVFRIEAMGTVQNTQKTITAIVSRQDPKKPQIFYWKVS